MLLTDDHNDRMRLPTKRNILRGFEWLMRDLQDGESLFFYFAGARRSRAAMHCCIAGSRPSSPAPRAGHGGQQRDRAGVEPSGYNQTICPCDYAEEGAILDTQIHKALVKPLPRVRRPRRCARSWLPAQLPSLRRRPPRVAQSVALQALIDSCHSGTVMNLPWNAELERGKLRRWSEEYKGEHWKRVRAPARARVPRQRAMTGCPGHSKPACCDSAPCLDAEAAAKPCATQTTAGGLVVQFSAARHDQTAAVRATGGAADVQGAATYSFVNAIKRHAQVWGFGIV